MKLAEALLLRSDIQKKITSLRDRIVASAVVQEGDKPVYQPYVVAARWPLSSDMLTSSVHKLEGGADGKFTIGGLSPGEYRIFAVSRAASDKLSDPSVLQRLLMSAEKVTLDRGGIQNVELKPADPSR